MAVKRSDDLTDTLRSLGVKRKLAHRLGDLDGNSRRDGSKGEQLARQAVQDLSTAVDEIRERVLTSDPKRRAAGRKAASTRKRASASRRTSAKRGAQTRARVKKARSS